MTFEARSGSGDSGPFRKPFAPPQVIFRNGVVLREIETDNFHACTGFLSEEIIFFCSRRHQEIQLQGRAICHERLTSLLSYSCSSQ